MKLKELECFLSQCDSFKKPKIELEQYATSSHIAARMIYSAQDDISGASVCDLGSGCGILAIGAVIAEAAYVYAFEFDSDALDIARTNSEELLDPPYSPLEFLQVRLTEDLNSSGLNRFSGLFDVVLMNPPFGTKKNVGSDFVFLNCASRLVKPGGHIYSLHKTSTRNFFERRMSSDSSIPANKNGNEELGLRGQVLAEVSFDLPKSYRFHKEKCVNVAVDFWRFEKL